MIAQGRLTGRIDQSKSLLHFVSANVLQNWDANIENGIPFHYLVLISAFSIYMISL